MRKLLTITDTEFFVNKQKEVWLFHSVCRELESISNTFKNQELIGKVTDKNNSQFQKAKYPIIARTSSFINLRTRTQLTFIGLRGIIKLISTNSAKYIHVRGPSIVLFMVLIVTPFFKKKKFWFKYANVWNESGRSIFWDIQKWLLKRNRNIKVTVNGNWPDLPKHIISFENPCFYEKDLEESKSVEKVWPKKKKAVFMGRITEEKGVFRILEGINSDNVANLSELVFVGEGRDIDRLLQELSNHPYKELIKVLGPASKDKVLEILEESHLLLLPTTSPEGFPKVISEAWLKSCLPVTSDISSIPQYVKDGKTGFVWKRKTDHWETIFTEALMLEESAFNKMKKEIEQILPLFTYEYFAKRIKKEVFEID